MKGSLGTRILRAPSNMTDDAPGLLLLVLGMEVMITDNVAMCGGVANGCIGTFPDIKYGMNGHKQRRAVCAYVCVSGFNVHAPGISPSVIPILPERNVYKYKTARDTTYNISRSQLPLGVGLCIHSQQDTR